MRLRDFQIYAPYRDRDVNGPLTVLSEVVQYWLMRQPDRTAPFMKLVIAVYEERSWKGDDFIVWPDNIAELDLAEPHLSRSWVQDRDLPWALAAIRSGLEVAIAQGAALEQAAITDSLEPALRVGPPFRERVDRLDFADRRTKRQYHVVHEFDHDFTRFVVTDSKGTRIETMIELDTFSLPELLFPARRVRVANGRASFIGPGQSEIAWLDLPSSADD